MKFLSFLSRYALVASIVGWGLFLLLLPVSWLVYRLMYHGMSGSFILYFFVGFILLMLAGIIIGMVGSIYALCAGRGERRHAIVAACFSWGWLAMVLASMAYGYLAA